MTHSSRYDYGIIIILLQDFLFHRRVFSEGSFIPATTGFQCFPYGTGRSRSNDPWTKDANNACRPILKLLFSMSSSPHHYFMYFFLKVVILWFATLEHTDSNLMTIVVIIITITIIMIVSLRWENHLGKILWVHTLEHI